MIITCFCAIHQWMQILAAIDPEAEKKVRAHDIIMRKKAMGAGDANQFREGIRKLFKPAASSPVQGDCRFAG